MLTCPRCHAAAYERRSSYDVCFECFFSEPPEELIPVESIPRKSINIFDPKESK